MPPPRTGRIPQENCAPVAPADPGRRVTRSRAPGTSRARAVGSARLLLDDREYVAGREHQVLLARVLHFGAAVLAVEHNVADADVDWHALARVVYTTRTNREDLALLGLLLRGVRDDKPGRGDLLGLKRLDHNAVLERLQNNLGGGR